MPSQKVGKCFHVISSALAKFNTTKRPHSVLAPMWFISPVVISKYVRLFRILLLLFSSFQLVLMHYKADINAPDNDGNTPLHLSTANGHEKVKRNVFLICTEHPIIVFFRYSFAVQYPGLRLGVFNYPCRVRTSHL